MWVPGLTGRPSPKTGSPKDQPPLQRHFSALADGWKPRLHAGFMALKGVYFAEDKGIVVRAVPIRFPVLLIFFRSRQVAKGLAEG